VYVVMDEGRIKELREERSLSKRALAEAAGITPKTARRAEREEPVSLWTARKVAAALGVESVRGLGWPLSRS
jgi:DNA-binding XRE family transcriptional regulator